jgi:NADPH-dependent F420 reductase
VKVAIVGGTGSFGRALAKQLRAAGDESVIGSRDATRAAEQAAVIGVQGTTNAEAVRGVDLVVLATRSNAAIETAVDLAEAIGATPVLCVASDLRFTPGGVLPGRSGRSIAEEIADALVAPVAAGLQSVPAAALAAGKADQDALICGDDPTAKALALALGEKICRRAIDAGPLANARALEGMTAVILSINKRYGGHAGISLTGLPEQAGTGG